MRSFERMDVVPGLTRPWIVVNLQVLPPPSDED